MITDRKAFAQWEERLVAGEAADLAKGLRLLEAMVDHARVLGVWPPADPLEGIEVDIEVARVVNSLRSDR
jgi:hypothetical protein